MTTIQHQTVQCAICGAKQQGIIITSTSQFGSPELDLRPPEPERSNLPFWITRCTDCGYCAPSIAASEPGMAEIVRATTYQAQLGDTDNPELTNSFVCCGFLWEGVGRFPQAAWSLTCAAWAADGTEADEAARRCRMRAASLYERALAAGSVERERVATIRCIHVDLLRRAGAFDEALAACRQALTHARDPESILRQVLAYERRLIEQRNAEAHRVDEVIEPEPGGQGDE